MPKVFITGATGFIGSHVVQEFLSAGYEVLGLTRSDKGAEHLKTLGAEPHRGDLNDIESLKAGASASDGVCHLAYQHDHMLGGNKTREELRKIGDDTNRLDREAISAMASVLKDSNRPLINTYGTLGTIGLGRPGTEDDVEPSGMFGSRGQSQILTSSFAAEGVRAMTMRLPPSVHGDHDKGFIAMIISAARKNSRAVYIGDGENVWPTTHVKDVARAYRLAFEKGTAGAIYQPLAEGAVRTKDIASKIGEKLSVPVQLVSKEEGPQLMGFMGIVFGMHNPMSCEKTKRELGWEAKERTLLEDLEVGTYFETA